MALEMKVPSPGESITEVEIAQWLVEDGDYVEKDQAVAEVDSDKATLELPAEASGIITLKAEEGDVVEVGEVVCLIDTEAEKPGGGDSDDKPAEEEDKERQEDKEDRKTVIRQKLKLKILRNPVLLLKNRMILMQPEVLLRRRRKFLMKKV